MIDLRPLTAQELSLLLPLSLRSKKYWNYEPAFLQTWASDFVPPSPDACRAGFVLAAVESTTSQLVGYYGLKGEAPKGRLSHLFVEPEHIGHGVGRLLLEAAMQQATDLGMQQLAIIADVNAVSFYKHFGAQQVGTVQTKSGPLPCLDLPLTTTA